MVLNKLHLTSLLLVFLPCTSTKQLANAASFIYAGCSPSKYDPITPFQNNLDSLLTSIVAGASLASYNSYTSGDESRQPPGMTAYGLFQCRDDMGAGDCSACVQSAVGQLNQVCPESFAASLQLDGCFVRFSNEDFLGKLDAVVVYHKCSTATSEDEAFLQRRDDVLVDLQGGASFRVSSSSAVQGVVQCVGDLSAGDCSKCVAEAVGQLKDACGSAIAADVYLAQCYARYWASGYYFRSSQGDYNSDDDRIGRTVAIIVGILAGLVLIVVILSFLKRAC